MLRKEGWRVLRFWKTQILKSPESCIEEIEKAIKATPKTENDILFPKVV